MTDRVKGFYVTLKKDVRIDDVEPIMNAIEMISGVAKVTPSVTDAADHVARVRAKQELYEKIFNIFMEDTK